MTRFHAAASRAVNNRMLSFGGSGGFNQPDFWDGQGIFTSPVGFNGDETIENDFDAYVEKALKSNGIVFACVATRQFVFSQARFQFQRLRDGRPAGYFGTPELGILERPWRGGTTGELLARMEQDVSLAGNWFGVITGEGPDRRIRRLRPDWVKIITESPSGDPYDLDARVVGYIYDPDTPNTAPRLLDASQVAHWSPMPDPQAQWRGMSWLTPVIREIQADLAATEHKLSFFRRGATTNIVVKYPPSMQPERVKAYAEAFADTYGGVDNAYKTIHIGEGADLDTIGTDLRQLEFKATQGAGETRIAAASGLGAVMAQLSEGLSGSSLNSGNFDAARKRAETTLFRPLWSSAAATLEQLIQLPEDGSRLAPDLRDVAFIRADQKAEAEIHATNVAALRQLIDAGWEPEAAIQAVESGDLSNLAGQHTGLFSVQLQPAGADASNPTDDLEDVS